MARFWDFGLPSAEVRPTTVSKYNTFAQLVLIGGTVAVPLVLAQGWETLPLPSSLTMLLSGDGAGEAGSVGVRQAMAWAQVLVAGTTIYSGVSYLWAKGVVVVLSGSKERERAILRRGRGVMAVCFAMVGGMVWWVERRGGGSKGTGDVVGGGGDGEAREKKAVVR